MVAVITSKEANNQGKVEGTSYEVDPSLVEVPSSEPLEEESFMVASVFMNPKLITCFQLQLQAFEEVIRTFLKDSSIEQVLVGVVEDNTHQVDKYRQVVDNNTIDYNNPLVPLVEEAYNSSAEELYMVIIVKLEVDMVLNWPLECQHHLSFKMRSLISLVLSTNICHSFQQQPFKHHLNYQILQIHTPLNTLKQDQLLFSLVIHQDISFEMQLRAFSH